jgi:hypothetical protein
MIGSRVTGRRVTGRRQNRRSVCLQSAVRHVRVPTLADFVQ